MPTNEREIIDGFIRQLDEVFNADSKIKNYRFDRDVSDWNEVTKKQYRYDIVIKLKNQPIAVVEVSTDYITPSSKWERLKSYPINVRFIIITDGHRISVLDRQKDEVLEQEVRVNILPHIFANKPTQTQINQYKEEFARAFFGFLTQYHPDRFREKSEVKIELDITFDEILENLEFDAEKNELSFKTGRRFEFVEAKIFNFLLPDLKYFGQNQKQSIFRYTTLDTLHFMLKGNSYRINGIRGMNDPSDGIFIDRLISPYANFEDNDLVEDLNKKFVSSCSLKGDDLTMWRLYGDNSKGVCIELETTKPRPRSGFYIKKIVYLRNEREAIVTLFTRVFEYFISRGITFRFRWLDAFKLFFKSHDYAVEREVRILYVNDNNIRRDWMIAQPYGILNPFVQFDLLWEDPILNGGYTPNPHLPFKIKKIILGPNCPFKNKNLGQIKDLLKEKKFNGVTTVLSRIESDTYIA